MSSNIVAENRNKRGEISLIASNSKNCISGRNPISSIRSASSKTTKFTLLNLIFPRLIKSSNRPGVAIRTCPPLCICSI